MSLNYGLNSALSAPCACEQSTSVAICHQKYRISARRAKITFSCTVVIEGIEKPACVAEFLAMIFE